MLKDEHTEKGPISIEEELLYRSERAKTFIFFDFECTEDDINQWSAPLNPPLQTCEHEKLPNNPVWLLNWIAIV